MAPHRIANKFIYEKVYKQIKSLWLYFSIEVYLSSEAEIWATTLGTCLQGLQLGHTKTSLAAKLQRLARIVNFHL